MNPVYLYLMEDPREASRLTEKVDAPEFISKYLKEYINSDTNEILDIGCGPAEIDSCLGLQYPAIQITGIDISTERIKQATHNIERIPNIRIINADAVQLPFEDNSFDLIFCRFLLEYLPDKIAAIKEMKRVCRPGGRVMLQDLDGQLISMYPEFPNPIELKIILDHLAETGFDPFVGRKLYYLSRLANLQVIKVQIEPYHVIAGTIDAKGYKAWELKLDIALPQIAKALGGNEKAIAFKKAYLDYLLGKDTFSYSTIFTIVSEKLNVNS